MAKKQPTQGVQRYIVRPDKYDEDCVFCNDWKEVQHLIESLAEDDSIERVMEDLLIYELGAQVKVRHEQKITIERVSS